MTAIFQAIAAFFAWLTGRSTAANSAKMVENKQAHAEQAAKDDDAQTIAKASRGDKDALDKLRREAAE